MLDDGRMNLLGELGSIKIMLGLIFSSLPQESVEQISSRLQSMHDHLGDDYVARDAAQRAALFVASLPAEKQPKNMRELLRIIPGGKSGA